MTRNTRSAKVPTPRKGPDRPAEEGRGKEWPKDTEDRKVRHNMRDLVLKRIESGAGSTVYLQDIVRDMGLLTTSVQNCVNSLRKTVPQIQVVVAGRAWRWNANAAPTAEPAKASKAAKRVFEELAVTKAGEILIQDEDGKVYKAVDV